MNFKFFLHEMYLMHVLWMSHRYLKQIMVIWKEHEHELDDSQVTNYPNTVMYSRECGVLKHFSVLGMKSHVHLLEGDSMKVGNTFWPNLVMKTWCITHVIDRIPRNAYIPCEFWLAVKKQIIEYYVGFSMIFF